VLARDGVVACNYAGMIAFLHGKAESAFDWSLRPLFLRFNTTDKAERVSAFHELCDMCGAESEAMLAASRADDAATGSGERERDEGEEPRGSSPSR
jgi:hypothetical protein